GSRNCPFWEKVRLLLTTNKALQRWHAELHKPLTLTISRCGPLNRRLLIGTYLTTGAAMGAGLGLVVTILAVCIFAAGITAAIWLAVLGEWRRVGNWGR